MGRGKTKPLLTAFLTSVVALGATGAFAQDSPVTANLTLSTTLGADTNPGLAATSAGTEWDLSEQLSFSVTSETSTQILTVSGGAGLSFSKTVGGASNFDVTSPNVALNYARDAAASKLSFDANFRTDNVTTTFDNDPTAAVSLIVDTGTLEVSGAAATYGWGLNAPLGFSVTASRDVRNYTGTTDPALFDNATHAVSASANLRISPATQGSLTLSRTDYTSSDAFSTSSETTQFNFGVSHEVSTALMLDGNIGFREKSTTASATTTTTSGLISGVNVTQTVPNGSIFGGLNYDDSGARTSTALTFGRSLDFPAGTLSANLTADWTDGYNTQLLGAAKYTQQLPDGSVSVDFSQSLNMNTLSQDIKFSKLGLGFQKSLNSNAGVNLTVDLRRTEDAGGGVAPTQNRARLSAQYLRDLTPDWGLAVGYTRLQNSGSAVATTISDKVFLTLTRDIQFGF